MNDGKKRKVERKEMRATERKEVRGLKGREDKEEEELERKGEGDRWVMALTHQPDIEELAAE